MVSRIGRSLKTCFRSAVIKGVASLWEKQGGGVLLLLLLKMRSKKNAFI